MSIEPNYGDTMKNPKTPKPNTETKPKRAFVLQDYIDASNIRKSKEMNQKIEIFAEKLMEWALYNDDAIIIREFFVENGISPNSVTRWSKRSPKFKAAYELASTAIGVRREKGAMFHKFSEGMTLKSLPFYSVSWTDGEDWKKLEEWRSDLRKTPDEQKGDTIIKVEMPSYLEKKDG